jgi:prophage antirepressor-like protein
MTNLVKFQFQNHSVRAVNIDGEIWWIANDVCGVLGINNSRKATSRLDNDEKNTVTLSDGIAGNPSKTIINESGLYSLILSSKKPEAKAFKRWVTHEVLPSIRKTGSYISPESKLEKLEDEFQKLHLKLLAFEEYQSDELIGFDEAAALIAAYRKPPFGVKHFKQWLAEHNIICTPFHKNDKPVQKYLDSGWFRCVTYEYWRAGKRRYETRYLLTWRGISELIDIAIDDKLVAIPAGMKHQYLPGLYSREMQPQQEESQYQSSQEKG